mgnify:CR=1 FL=1
MTKSKKKEKLCIILPSLEVGGVEKLWLEFARRTKKFDVCILVLSDRIDVSLLERGDKILEAKNIISKRNFFFTYCFGRIDLTSFDHIHCVDRFGLLFATEAQKNLNCKITMGIYQSNEMLWSPSFHYAKLQSVVFERLLGSNIYFGNDYVKKIYDKRFLICTAPHCVFPAGIKLFAPKTPSKVNYHIAIIGRHTNFKSYIQNFLSTWKNSNFGVRKETSVSVVGDGPLTPLLKRKFPEASFLGTLQYNELRMLLEDVDFVLCSGTTVPLVASSGTPVLLGEENSEHAKTIGFFHEVEQEAYNLSTVDSHMWEFTRAVKRFYAHVQFDESVPGRNVEKAQIYDIKNTVQNFEYFFEQSDYTTNKITRTESWWYRISLFMWLLFEIACNRKIIRSRYLSSNEHH